MNRKAPLIVGIPEISALSAGYHLIGDRFIFTSGAFQAGSVIHEFLHHAVHPVMVAYKDTGLKRTLAYPGIDASYYLSGDDAGRLNAGEEFVVRALTEIVLARWYPPSLPDFIAAAVRVQ